MSEPKHTYGGRATIGPNWAKQWLLTEEYLNRLRSELLPVMIDSELERDPRIQFRDMVRVIEWWRAPFDYEEAWPSGGNEATACSAAWDILLAEYENMTVTEARSALHKN